MAYRYKSPLTRDDVTPKEAYLNRRQIMAGAAGMALAGAAEPAAASLGARKTAYGKDLEATSYEDITSYNNFYELGTGKDDPKRNAHRPRRRRETM
ncbi:MAG: hypothetical protein AAFN59_02285, partial [Pseudomonadota bacterium]